MEATKENDSAVAATAPAPAPPPPAASFGEAVDSSSSTSLGYPQKRKRFRIDLVPGETTIVSWKKLLSEGKYEIKEPCAPVEVTDPAVSCLKQESESRDDQDNLLKIENSSTKNSDKKVHWGENSIHINEASKLENCRPKKRRKDKAEAPEEKDSYHKKLQNVISNSNHDEKQQHYSFHASVGFSIEKPCDPSIRFECSSVAITVNQCSSGLPSQDSKTGVCTYSSNTENNIKFPSDKRRKEHSTSVRHRDNKNIPNQLPDLNLPYPTSSPTYGSLHAKDASDGRQNGTASENIIAKSQ